MSDLPRLRWPKLSAKQIARLRAIVEADPPLPMARDATTYSLVGFVKMHGIRREPLVRVDQGGYLHATDVGIRKLAEEG